MEDQLTNPTVDNNRKSALGSALQEFARSNYAARQERERMGMLKPVTSSAPATNARATQAAPSSPAQPRYSDERLSTRDIYSDERLSTRDIMAMNMRKAVPSNANFGQGTQYTPGRLTGKTFNPSTMGNITTPATPSNGLSRGVDYSEAEKKRLGIGLSRGVDYSEAEKKRLGIR
jgi:hypothetical protein